ncbi:hypothetical protein GCM10027288_24560 [Bordetella tumbae]
MHGATAAGLINPDSITAAAPKFRKFLKRQPKDATLVFHLGEVDCGILIWMRVQKNASSLQAELRRSVAAYFSFIDELIGEGYRDIIITSATLPTINDFDQLGAVVNERRSKVTATQVERTQLTLDFNRYLQTEALSRGLGFVDVSSEMLNSTSGVVDTSFRNKNPANHHMDNNMAATIWASAISKKLFAQRNIDLPSGIWQATSNTLLKAYVSPYRSLRDAHKFSVSVGQTLSAKIAGYRRGHVFIVDASLDGVNLSPELRYIFVKHWTPPPHKGIVNSPV